MNNEFDIPKKERGSTVWKIFTSETTHIANLTSYK